MESLAASPAATGRIDCRQIPGREHIVTDTEPSETSSPSPPTQWTVVVRARDPSSPEGAAALGQLLQAYAPVLSRYATGVLRLPPEQAEDLVQEFVARKVLEQRLLDSADRARGRFRSFLLKCFINFVRGQQRKDRAAKRGPGAAWQVNVEDHGEVLADPRQGRQKFDALWARQTLAAALDRMQQECLADHRPDIWGIFQRRMLDPVFSNEPVPPYEQLVGEFHLRSPAQASNLLITAKRSFRRALDAVVRETVSSDAEVAEELAALKRALASSGPAR